MRGKAIVHLPFVLRVGITPAHAGKSFTQLHPNVKIKDHPRACGEKTKKIP